MQFQCIILGLNMSQGRKSSAVKNCIAMAAMEKHDVYQVNYLFHPISMAVFNSYINITRGYVFFPVLCLIGAIDLAW